MTNETTAVEVYQGQPPQSVFGTDDPTAIVARVSAIATPLAEFIKQRSMSMRLGQNEYVLSEGWSFMGQMIGVFPRTVRVEKVEREGALWGFEAQVELLTRGGDVVGGAVATCTRDENRWSWHPTNKQGEPIAVQPDSALMSMAQTRATGKAYRMGFGFVMKAAGYEATPAEEVDTEQSTTRRGYQTRQDARQRPEGADRQRSTRKEPVPPQPRRQPPEPGSTPPWRDELRRAMDDNHVTAEMIKAYLGAEGPEVLKPEWIDAWLEEEAGRTVTDLVVDVSYLDPYGASDSE